MKSCELNLKTKRFRHTHFLNPQNPSTKPTIINRPRGCLSHTYLAKAKSPMQKTKLKPKQQKNLKNNNKSNNSLPDRSGHETKDTLTNFQLFIPAPIQTEPNEAPCLPEFNNETLTTPHFAQQQNPEKSI
jgi:hypothetical protein